MKKTAVKKKSTVRKVAAGASGQRVASAVGSRKRAVKRKRVAARAARKPVSRKREAVAAFVDVPSTTRASHGPMTHFGIRLMSLVLLLMAAVTSNATIALANHDIRRADTLAQTALSHVEPRGYLYKVATERGLDYRLLERIAHCESGWRMVRNAGSSAYGYFQILDATEKHTPQYKEGRRKFDPHTNIDMAVYLYERYGTMPWNESKKCWGWYE